MTISLTSVATGPKQRYAVQTRLIAIHVLSLFVKVALDYNAPLLALAAYSVMQTTVDPFYTALEDGAYARVKPKGQPCDAVFNEGCPSPRLSPGARVAMALGITIVGVILIGMTVYWYLLGQRYKKVTY